MKTSVLISIVAALAISPAMANPDAEEFTSKSMRLRGMSEAITGESLFGRALWGKCTDYTCTDQSECENLPDCDHKASCRRTFIIIGTRKCR